MPRIIFHVDLHVDLHVGRATGLSRQSGDRWLTSKSARCGMCSELRGQEIQSALRHAITNGREALPAWNLRSATDGCVPCGVRYRDFTTLTRQIRLEEPVNTAKKLYWLAQFLLARHRLVKSPLRLIRIGVSTLVSPGGDQLLLPF